MACWMTLSCTVGMPSMRVPPFGLGISTRLTAAGIYLPSRMCAQMLAPCFSKCARTSLTLIPSIPGLLCWLSPVCMLSACFRETVLLPALSLVTSCVRPVCRSAWLLFRPIWPLPFGFGFRPFPSGAIYLVPFDFYSYCRRVRSSCTLYLQVQIRPFSTFAPTTASADFLVDIPSPCDLGSPCRASARISPGITHVLHVLPA